jgi:hypothetical protein
LKAPTQRRSLSRHLSSLLYRAIGEGCAFAFRIEDMPRTK